MKIYLFCKLSSELEFTQYTGETPVLPAAEVYGIAVQGYFPVTSEFENFTASSVEIDNVDAETLEIGFILTYHDGILFPLLTEIAGTKILPYNTTDILTIETLRGNSSITEVNAKKYSKLQFGEWVVQLYMS